MNPCREFIMTCAEMVSTTPGNYVPVKKTLPVLYKRIGEQRVIFMLASFVVAKYHGRMQKSVHQWALNQLCQTGTDLQKLYWPELPDKLLYDFAKEVIKNESRRRNVAEKSRVSCPVMRQQYEQRYPERKNEDSGD